MLVILLANSIHCLPGSRCHTFILGESSVEVDRRAVRYKMTELYLLCSRVRQENLQPCNAWNYHSKTPGAWGKPTPQMPLCPSLLYWEQPWKSFSLRPNLYTCGCQPSLVLDLTLEGELRARFGSGAVMCFYCCALKYIFSFLPRASGLSGSLNTLM